MTTTKKQKLTRTEWAVLTIPMSEFALLRLEDEDAYSAYEDMYRTAGEYRVMKQSRINAKGEKIIRYTLHRRESVRTGVKRPRRLAEAKSLKELAPLLKLLRKD